MLLPTVDLGEAFFDGGELHGETLVGAIHRPAMVGPYFTRCRKALLSDRLEQLIIESEVVANQLWDGDPLEVTETARRLDLAGYHRHQVFHMIGSVVSEEMWLMMRHHRQADLERIKHKLAGLPGCWESQPNRHPRKGLGGR